MLQTWLTNGVSSQERRREPRTELIPPVQGKIEGLDLPVTIIERSASGLSLMVSCALEVGSVYRVSFLDNGTTVTIAARVVHARRANTPEPTPVFFAGFSIVPGQ